MKRLKKILCCILVALFAFTSFGCSCTAEQQQLAVEVLQQLAKEAAAQQQAQQQAQSSSSPVINATAAPEDTSGSLSTAKPTATPKANPTQTPASSVQKGKSYSKPQDVADYLHLYKELPPNYLTKSEAQDMGWDSSLGNLYEVTNGMSIGGDYFSNYQKLLPTKNGRKYYECDVNYYGGYRGAERLVFSNDGLIFYTKDHYESFTQLY